MSKTIAVTLQSPQSQSLGGPVAVTVTITNSGSKPASVLLPYPNPNNLSFRSASKDFVEAKLVESDPIERTAPTPVPPGGKQTATYYLNRYFRFLRHGKAEFTYELGMLVSMGKDETVTSKSETFSGAFEVELVNASDDTLRSQLAQFSAKLSDPGQKTRMEAAEALAFVDSPLVVPYLLPMLHVNNLGVIAIQALGRHPSPESERAIRSSLGHAESSVVEAALVEIDRLKMQVPRQDVQKLLASSNPSVQWLALGWLATRPDRQDLPLLIPLVRGGNEQVRERARGYLESLEKTK